MRAVVKRWESQGMATMLSALTEGPVMLPIRVYERNAVMDVSAYTRPLDMPELVKVWRRAAELVEQGWCQNYMARDQRGIEVPYDDPSATHWCLAGALYRAVREIVGQPPVGRLDMSMRTMWNDEPERTAAQVAQRLRTEAALAETLMEGHRGDA